MVWHQEPDNIFYMLMDDGSMSGLTYMREEGVIAWSKHKIAGTAAGDADVISAQSVPSPTNDRDDMYILVERVIDGNTVKYIEWVSPYYRDGDGRADVVYADSAFVYEDVLTDTVSGLDHLEGETVGVIVDGATHPDLVVTGGSITLENDIKGVKIIIGLKYEWFVVLPDVRQNTSQGSMKGKVRTASGLVINLWETLGITYGQDDSDQDEDVLGYGTVFSQLIPLFTGSTDPLPIPDPEDNRKTAIKIGHDGMLPACLLNCVWEMAIED